MDMWQKLKDHLHHLQIAILVDDELNKQPYG